MLKFQRKIIKDHNCWACHRNGSRVFCSKCGHGFHPNCAKLYKEKVVTSGTDIYTLRECHQCFKAGWSKSLHTVEIYKRKFQKMDKAKLNETMKAALIGIQSPPEIMRTIKVDGKFENVLQFINLDTIETKMENYQYRYPEELLYDLRKIKHAMRIEFGRNEETNMISQYITSVKKVFHRLDLCPHCVHNDYWADRTSLCPWLHRPILFDRSEGIDCQDDHIKRELEKFPILFPGKILDFNRHSGMAHVQFFGIDGQFSIKVPRKNIYHLRQIDVDRCIDQTISLENESDKENLSKAIEELNEYLWNLNQQLGDINKWQFTQERRIFRSTDGTFVSRGVKVSSTIYGSSPNHTPNPNLICANDRIRERNVSSSTDPPQSLVATFRNFRKRVREIDDTIVARKRSTRSNTEAFQNRNLSSVDMMDGQLNTSDGSNNSNL